MSSLLSVELIISRAYYQSSIKWLLRFKFVMDLKFVLVELETATQEIVLLWSLFTVPVVRYVKQLFI
jgi:hypothetical protein